MKRRYTEPENTYMQLGDCDLPTCQTVTTVVTFSSPQDLKDSKTYTYGRSYNPNEGSCQYIKFSSFLEICLYMRGCLYSHISCSALCGISASGSLNPKTR